MAGANPMPLDEKSRFRDRYSSIHIGTSQARYLSVPNSEMAPNFDSFKYLAMYLLPQGCLVSLYTRLLDTALRILAHK